MDKKVTKYQSEKYEDFYLKIRKKIFNWLNQGKISKMQKGNGWMTHFIGYLVLLPDLVHLLIKLFMDGQIPLKFRSMLIVIFAYLLSPIDFIPDFIPVLGLLDDLLVVIIFMNKVINNDSPQLNEKIKKYWAGEEDVFKKVKEIIHILNQYAGKIPKSLADYMNSNKS